MIAVTSAISFGTISRLVSALQWVEQTHTILDQLVMLRASSEAEFKRIEGALAFEQDLTRPEFVQSKELVQISERLNNLSSLAHDSRQLVRLASFTDYFYAYRKGLEEVSRLSATSPNKARAKLESESRLFQQTALVLVIELEEAERQLLEKGLDHLHEQTRWASYSGAFLMVMVIIVIVITAVSTRSHFLFREKAAKATSTLIADLERMNRLTEVFQLCSSTSEALRIVQRVIGDVAPNCSVSVSRLNNSHNLLVCETEEPGVIKKLFLPAACCAFRLSKPHKYQSGSYTVACDHFESALPSRYMCVPMLAHGELIGVIHVVNESTTMLLSDDVAKSIEAVAEQAALALCNLILQERLHEQSIRDPLTGLFNRRYMEITLERELNRCSRNRANLAFLILDLDHFKAINDEFGHETGDHALRSVAETLKSGTRAEDIVCRYGGEEFVVVLPGCSQDQAVERAEHIRMTISGVRVLPRTDRYISCSIGVSVFPEDGDLPEELAKTADIRLYRAKHEGRNRVVACDAESARTKVAASPVKRT